MLVDELKHKFVNYQVKCQTRWFKNDHNSHYSLNNE